MRVASGVENRKNANTTNVSSLSCSPQPSNGISEGFQEASMMAR